MSKRIIAVLAAGLLVTLACRAVTNLTNFASATAGPTQTEDISIPVPAQTPPGLEIIFGAGNLMIAPGAQDALVSGTATYNVADLKPVVHQNGANVRLSTGELDTTRMPNYGANVKNTWDIKLGNVPMNLTINAGAFQGNIDLGGLSILSLNAFQGASQVTFDFSSPNQSEMSDLTVQTGASTTRMENLANANFANMLFRGGAGDYTLDFGGTLKRDAKVRIEAGLGQATLIVPEGTSARANMQGGLTNVSSSGGWKQTGSDYVLGSGSPQITIVVVMGAGSLNLQTK